MASPDTPDDSAGAAGEARLRIGDSERMAAVHELSIHYTEGRLDSLEMDERSGDIAAARTRADLRKVFEDLPDDEDADRDPVLAVALGNALTKADALAKRTPSEAETAAAKAKREKSLRTRRTLMALTPPVAFLLFFLLLNAGFYFAWIVFFAIPAVGGLLFGSEMYEEEELEKKRRLQQLHESERGEISERDTNTEGETGGLEEWSSREDREPHDDPGSDPDQR